MVWLLTPLKNQIFLKKNFSITPTQSHCLPRTMISGIASCNTIGAWWAGFISNGSPTILGYVPINFKVLFLDHSHKTKQNTCLSLSKCSGEILIYVLYDTFVCLWILRPTFYCFSYGLFLINIFLCWFCWCLLNTIHLCKIKVTIQ